MSRAEEGRPLVTGFTARDTRVAGYSWTTIQDEHGVFYFGCDGVFTYDGERWTKYTVPGSYAVRGLAFGANGRLWVGAFNEVGYFEQTERGLSSYHSLVSSLPEAARELGDVWEVFARGDGAVFVTTHAVLVWDGSLFKILDMPGAERSQGTQAGGKIYVSQTTVGVRSLEPDGLREFISAKALKNAGVIWMEKAPAGWLLATTEGLFHYTDGAISDFGQDVTEFIRKNVLLCACRLPHGDLCLGTLNGGIGIVSPSGAMKRVITTENGLLSRTVFSLFVARDGALWAMSANGSTRIALDIGVSLFDSRQGLTGKPCIKMAQTGSQILVATGEGVFGLPTDVVGDARFAALPDLTARYTDLESGPGDTVYAAGLKRVDQIQGLRANQIFSSNTSVFLFRRSLTNPKSFLVANGFDIERFSPGAGGEMETALLAHLPDIPKTLVEDESGNIWIGTVSRGAFLVPRGSDKAVPPIRLTQDSELPDTGHGGVARVNDSVVVFTNKGAELHTPAWKAPLLLAAAPRSTAFAVSNRCLLYTSRCV